MSCGGGGLGDAFGARGCGPDDRRLFTLPGHVERGGGGGGVDGGDVVLKGHVHVGRQSLPIGHKTPLRF